MYIYIYIYMYIYTYFESVPTWRLRAKPTPNLRFGSEQQFEDFAAPLLRASFDQQLGGNVPGRAMSAGTRVSGHVGVSKPRAPSITCLDLEYFSFPSHDPPKKKDTTQNRTTSRVQAHHTSWTSDFHCKGYSQKQLQT